MPRQHLPNGQPIWIDLATSNPQGAQSFYAAVLGWTYDIGGPEFGHYAVARCDGLSAAGIGGIPSGVEMPPAWTVYFGVASVDDTLTEATTHGGRVLAPAMDIGDFGRMAVVEDPTGAAFGLWQPVTHKGVSIVGEPGAFAWSEVNTRDAAAAAAFYTTVFGLRDERMEMQGTPYHMLHTAEGPCCGVLQMTDEWGDLPPHWMAYFAVADADAAKATVIQHGGQAPFGPFDSPYGRILVAVDPQGAAVSFIELSRR